MKTKASFFYLIGAFWIIFLLIFLKFFGMAETGLGITLAFLTLIMVPGLIFSSFLNIKSHGWAQKFLYSVGLGFVYYFLINLSGILLNLNINQLLYVWFILLLLISIFSFIKDLKKDFIINLSFLKNQKTGDWILFVFLVISSIFAFYTVNVQSDKLIGDGYFHLAILQKVVSGQGLSSSNLGAVKTSSPAIIYAFPIWHILIGGLSKVLDISVISMFKQAVLPLSLIALSIWYCIISIFFKNKYLSAVIFFSFILIFLHDNNFYYLIALASPDSFNRLIFFPLILGLLAVFLFDEKISWQTVILLILLASFLGLIHFVQFIYFAVILLVLGILCLFFKRSKEIYLKIGILILGLGLLILSALLLHFNEVKKLIFANFQAFPNQKIVFNTFLGANVFYRYAIITLSLCFVFVKKQKSVLIPISVTFSALLIYWPYFGLQTIFLKAFGAIPVERALANLPHFIFFGILLFFVILFINFLNFIIFKRLLWVPNAIFGVLFFLIIFGVLNTTSVANLLFNEATVFVGFYFFLGLFLTSLSAILVYYYFDRINLVPYDLINFVLIFLVIIATLGTPYLRSSEKSWKNNPNGSLISDRNQKFGSEASLVGGYETLAFFQSVHQKIILSDSVNLTQILLAYSDNYAAEYPYDTANFSQSSNFYNQKLSFDKRLAVINELNADLVIVRHQEEADFLSSQPNFQEVFESDYTNQNHTRKIFVFEYLK